MGAILETELVKQGAGKIGNIVDAGMGMILGKHYDRRQLEQQKKMQALQIQGQKEMGAYNLEQQMKLWNQTNYGAQMEHLKKAGLNPGLLYGMSGGGGQTAAAQPGNVSGGAAPSGGKEVESLMGMGLQRQLLQAQKENIEADTENKKAQTTKTAGIDTELGLMDKIIKEFAGKELKSTYEKVKEPNRGIEAKTHQDELEARQGVAGTIYEMWKEGKLKDKSMAEVEQILVNNAKTRAQRQEIEKRIDLIEQQTKGATLDNVIKEIEAKLQAETGIDKNSAGWLKILGRLFVKIFGGTSTIEKVIRNTE